MSERTCDANSSSAAELRAAERLAAANVIPLLAIAIARPAATSRHHRNLFPVPAATEGDPIRATALRTRALSTSGAVYRIAFSDTRRRVSPNVANCRAHAGHAARCRSISRASSGGSSPSSRASRESWHVSQSMSARLPSVDLKQHGEPLPRPGKPRHDRADRDAHHLADLPIAQVLDFP